MEAKDVYLDAFERVKSFFHAQVEGMSDDDLVFRAGPEANTVAWLAWHLTRVQDDHVAEVAHADQVWTSTGWCQEFGTGLDQWDTGYGHQPEQVAMVRARADLLLGYHDEVYKRTRQYIQGLGAKDFDAVVDRRFDPPVTLGARLVSVVADDLQHIGQIGFVKGLIQRP
jgi:hypothetical protein